MNPEWWTHDIKEIITEKEMAYMTWLGTKDPEVRKIMSNLTERIMTGKKNELRETKCEELDRYLGGSRHFYSILQRKRR